MSRSVVIQLMSIPVGVTYNAISWQKLAAKIANILMDSGRSEYKQAVTSLENVRKTDARTIQDIHVTNALGYLERTAGQFYLSAQKLLGKTKARAGTLQSVRSTSSKDRMKLAALYRGMLECYATIARIYVEMGAMELAMKYAYASYKAWYYCNTASVFDAGGFSAPGDPESVEILTFIAKLGLPFKEVFNQIHATITDGIVDHYPEIWALEGRAKQLAAKM
jgi:hypothetical protein